MKIENIKLDWLATRIQFPDGKKRKRERGKQRGTKYDRMRLAKDESIEHAMYKLITYRYSISEVKKKCSN